MTAIVVASETPDIIITNTKYIPDQRTDSRSCCVLGLALEQIALKNKKHLKNVGPIRYCELLLRCQSPGVASRTPAIAIAQAACDVHANNNNNNNNDNA